MVTVAFYNNFLYDLALGRFNLDADTFKVMLVNGYTYNATHTSKSQITGELLTENGYTAGGETIPNPTITETSGVVKWDGDDVTWTATGGDIGPATGAVIYNDTVTSPEADRLVCYIDFGDEESAGASTQFKIVFNSNGIATIG